MKKFASRAFRILVVSIFVLGLFLNLSAAYTKCADYFPGTCKFGGCPEMISFEACKLDCDGGLFTCYEIEP